MYYCVENSREYQEVGPQFMDVDSDTAPAIEALIQKYPEYIKVEDLPMDELDGKLREILERLKGDGYQDPQKSMENLRQTSAKHCGQPL